MESKTISILGCGWLGLPLALHLTQHGYAVKGSTTTPMKLVLMRAEGIEPYLLNLDPTVHGDQVEDFFKADILFLNIPPGRKGGAEAAHRFGQMMEAVQKELRYSPIDFVVFASSTSVYDEMNGPVVEDDAGHPMPPRASSQALLAAEERFREDTHFDTTILRYAGLYGYDRPAGRFLAGKTDVPNGDAPVNLVHRDDAVTVTAQIIAHEIRGEVFNVCADEHPKRRDFYPLMARRQGLEPPTFAGGGPASFKVVSNEKLKQHLGYHFQHSNPSAPAP